MSERAFAKSPETAGPKATAKPASVASEEVRLPEIAVQLANAERLGHRFGGNDAPIQRDKKKKPDLRPPAVKIPPLDPAVARAFPIKGFPQKAPVPKLALPPAAKGPVPQPAPPAAKVPEPELPPMYGPEPERPPAAKGPEPEEE